ncbi:MAG: DUF393 domain-containing protein [Pseudomonadota bacterium]
MANITVFYDGACPLCRREIALMRRLDRRGKLQFENLADPDAAISCPIDRRELLARFHARLPDGEMVSGARAFTESYAQVPGLGWVAILGRFGPTRVLLEGLYRGFLRVRPAIQRLVSRTDQRNT